ncbi:3-oxoacyl-ACP synthase [Oceaniferula spumae]|uniref:3-oxoacyl-ACP synthase n=1 Tax=Oceaniferula spumae TaxID=2979115 RepID=A0AAT9FQ65_9BACT
MHIAITGIGLTSGLGDGPQTHAEKIAGGENNLKPLSSLLDGDSEYGDLKASWIPQRELLRSRKWAPASVLSLHVARQAIMDAGLTTDDLRDAAVIVGSSRGNIAGWVSPWPGRRPFDLMAASNSMHGELASSVSIEFGIRGPWQVISSGCAASLDALGMANMMMRQGMVKRAIVIGVELPLLPEVLEVYARTGVLSSSAVNDPYSPETSGFFPGEAGAAVVLESFDSPAEKPSAVSLTGYWCNSDADSPIGMPEDGAGLRDCLRKAVADLENEPTIAAVCPHASGTLLHGKAELAALRESLPENQKVSLHPLKPFTGHTVGASGLLDTAILAHFLRQQQLPANLPGLTEPDDFTLTPNKIDSCGSTVLKIAVGMGGHNSVVSLRSPDFS